LSIAGAATLASCLSLRALGGFSRGGAASFMSATTLGSSLSIRSFVRTGSAFSLGACYRSSGGSSVASALAVSSTLSLRGLGRGVTMLSVTMITHSGSSVSIRAFVRASSAVSLHGATRSKIAGRGEKNSIVDAVTLGSSLSLRSFGRHGLVQYFSTASFALVGSSVSMRRLIRAGSSLSIFSVGRLRCVTSLCDSFHSGSSLSLRSLSRLSGVAGLSLGAYSLTGSS
jgi:hypothetical protein